MHAFRTKVILMAGLRLGVALSKSLARRPVRPPRARLGRVAPSLAMQKHREELAVNGHLNLLPPPGRALGTVILRKSEAGLDIIVSEKWLQTEFPKVNPPRM